MWQEEEAVNSSGSGSSYLGKNHKSRGVLDLGIAHGQVYKTPLKVKRWSRTEIRD